ncbi:MAG TPA: SurA N-terminal domain-containing protein [Actinomycetota bacterium]|jgi:hypothetical protein|nr:SurA N-terminal domain-containing protein [Actinomycetota bacterium]
MTAPAKPIVMIAALVLSLGVVAAGSAYAFHLGPFANAIDPVDLGPVIARVDGMPIYLEEAAARVDGLTTVHGDVADVLGADWPDRVLRSLVDDQILRAQAQRAGIVVTEEDVQAYLEQIEGMIGADQTLDEWLQGQRMTMAELERRVELQIIGARVYLTVTDDVEVTPAELRAYYREHRLEFQEADGTIPPLLELRRSLRESLLKQAQDEAYAAWLEEARSDAEVVMVMDGWWRNL